jgi:hypothetical protein
LPHQLSAPSTPKWLMTTCESRQFTEETVTIDGQVFLRCHFERCLLVYRGGDLPGFSDCLFEDAEWKCEDAAFRTLAFFGVLHRMGAGQLLEDIVAKIREMPIDPRIGPVN